jgi:hypothetical protein
LVAELNEYNAEMTDFHKASELARVIGELNDVRERCDAIVMREPVSIGGENFTLVTRF